MKKLALVCMILLLVGVSFGVCPSADLTDDCEVNLEDFAVLASGWLTTYGDTDLYNMASEWLTHGVPEDPAKMAWVIINDSGAGMKDKNGDPINQGGFTGEMSKYETTNAQYCQFLNSTKVAGLITVYDNGVYAVSDTSYSEIYFKIYPGASTVSQIAYDGSKFSVRTVKNTNNNDIDMSNHPIVEVSWYGATAFCNYYGYRLPTEWEWQAVADYDGSYTYGCGTTIDSSVANYDLNNPLGLARYRGPCTSPVDYFDSFGYGVNDMTGNVWEWTNSIYGGSYRTCRGGGWGDSDYYTVPYRSYGSPGYGSYHLGFRVCR